MDVFSELGPLDVQLYEKDEIISRKSGLLSRSAFESLSEEVFNLFSHNMLNIKAASSNQVTFRLAADIATQLTSSLLSPIFAQINPDVIGSDYRDLSVAKEYGERLAKFSKNPKPNAVRRLVRDYPSHDFIIDRDEAAEMFENVSEPTPELYDLIGVINQVAYKEAGAVCALQAPESAEEDEHEEKGDDDAATAKANRESEPKMDEGGSADREGDPEEKLARLRAIRKREGG